MKLDLADDGGDARSCSRARSFRASMHLAAQAGVRYSLRGAAHLHRQQRHRHAERARGLPPQRRRASGVRLDELGLRRQHQHAVLGAQHRRSSAVAVRRHQARERADGAQLLGAVQAADHGPALLHGVRTVGPAGHGAVHVHAEHPRGQADRRLQQRPPQARLHLRRGHRRGRGARRGAHRAARPELEQQRAGPRDAATRHFASTTSATTSRCS